MESIEFVQLSVIWCCSSWFGETRAWRRGGFFHLRSSEEVSAKGSYGGVFCEYFEQNCESEVGTPEGKDEHERDRVK